MDLLFSSGVEAIITQSDNVRLHAKEAWVEALLYKEPGRRMICPVCGGQDVVLDRNVVRLTDILRCSKCNSGAEFTDRRLNASPGAQSGA